MNGSGSIYFDEDYLKISKTAKLNLDGSLVLNANRMGRNGRDRKSVV